MAAGLGFIEFATGDVLTAATANGYLASQTVMVFANSAARAAAITSPQEGMFTYLKDTDLTQYYSGSAYVTLGGASGGKILQVVTTTKTDVFTTTSTSFTDITGFSVTITPTSASSRILILSSINYAIDISSGQAQMQLLRGGTAIAIGDAAGSRTRATAGGAPPNNDTQTNYAGMFVDSPATTSATTYKFQARVSASTFCFNRNFNDTDAAYSPRTISTITVMEIGA